MNPFFARHSIALPFPSAFKVGGLCIFIGLLLASCGTSRYLEEGERLYTGAEIEVETPEKKAKNEIKRELSGVIRPNPNRELLGFLRTRLWFHNFMGEPEEESFRHSIQNRFGEEPVLFSEQQVERNTQLIGNRLFNKGFFNPDIRYEVQENNGHVSVTYQVKTGKPYKIGELHYPEGERELYEAIQRHKDHSLVEEGMNYDLDVLKSERSRLESRLREEGFFFFSENHLSFQADTSGMDRKAAVRLTIKEEVPDEHLVPYRLNDIYIHIEAPEEERAQEEDTVEVLTDEGEKLHFVLRGFPYRAEELKEVVTLRPGQLYSRGEHRKTINRVMSIGTFRFASIRYRRPEGGKGMLNANISITPNQKRTLESEIKAVTKTTNYAGPAFSTTLRNRNWLEGGEQLSFNVNTGFETRLSGQWSGLNSWELGTNLSLSVPRLIAPDLLSGDAGAFLPNTRFSIGGQMLNRVELYRMYAFTGQYGYTWQPSQFQRHVFNPVSVSFVNLAHTSEQFDERLAANPLLRQSFEEQFIPGMNYTFTFNTRGGEDRRKTNYYLQLNTDFSGNAVGLIQGFITGERPDLNEPLTLGGRAYSQYVKGDMDFRLYRDIGERRSIALRFRGGAGLPYGNSGSLPFVKQYSLGGANSIRAWHPRSIGPGGEPPAELDERHADRTGDIVFESSFEYRFDYTDWLKGAFFTDAGNVWLTLEDENRPDGNLELDQFYEQLAIGTGKGLRLDAGFFVLRLDAAFPLHDPHDGWLNDEIELGSSAWRQNNINYNLAVGYPF